ncbi:MAG TPA: hypothetical protein VFG59_10135 [Anaeromyxobacter sp.]|nr:hypothetical protein [Anaeromyxobacter sp.]
MQEAPQFEKEVVRLPDGRELTYYRFPEGRPQPAGKPEAPAPQGEKEP